MNKLSNKIKICSFALILVSNVAFAAFRSDDAVLQDGDQGLAAAFAAIAPQAEQIAAPAATAGVQVESTDFLDNGLGLEPVAPAPAAAAPAQEQKRVSHDAPPFTEVETKTEKMPGAEGSRGVSLLSIVKKRFDPTVGMLALGKPAFSGQRFVVGTEAEDQKEHEHLLICGNVQPIIDDAKADPVLHCLRLPEPIRDVQWAGGAHVMSGGASGKIYVHTVSSQGEMKQQAILNDVHTDAIRELAVNQLDPRRCASGAHDQKLCVFDINQIKITNMVKLDGVVGSVKWPEFNQNTCVSCTLDSGHYYVFDVRQAFDKAAYVASLNTPGLMTHARYSDHHVLFGFDNGEIQHIDMRHQKAILHRFKDPFSDNIGYIDCNSTGQCFLAGGYTDFTVWKNNWDTQVLAPWGHAVNTCTAFETGTGTTMAPAWYNDSTAVVSTSSGDLNAYVYDWNAQ